VWNRIHDSAEWQIDPEQKGLKRYCPGHVTEDSALDLFVDVLFRFQALYQGFDRRFGWIGSGSRREIHLSCCAVIISLGHSQPRSFRADQPMIWISLMLLRKTAKASSCFSANW
jgi:hypothetical protein